MRIVVKIARVLNAGGIAISICFVLAIAAKMAALSIASILARVGIAITAATPVAGIIVAGIYLYKNNETRYASYAVILLILLALAGIWRLLI
jgi:hypothetical protein